MKLNEEVQEKLKEAINVEYNAVKRNINRTNSHNYLCYPWNYTSHNDADFIFGNVLAKLRRDGYTIDILSRDSKISNGQYCTKYETLITW